MTTKTSVSEHDAMKRVHNFGHKCYWISFSY